MSRSYRTVVAVYKNRDSAERAAQALRSEGFGEDRISVTTNEVLSRGERVQEQGGGITGFFRNLFGGDVDDNEAGLYVSHLQQGETVVTAPVIDQEVDRAADILERFSPIDIDVDTAYTDANPNTAVRDRGTVAQEGTTIPVIEEEVQVGKRPVHRGGVRVYSHVVEEPVEEQVSLREEHVRVDRRPADRPATEADIRNAEQSFEMTEMAEEPVVGKKTRVREEIVVGKEATERTETIRDTVRRTDVDVEPMETARGSQRSNVEGGRTQKWDTAQLQNWDADYRKDFQSRYGMRGDAKYEAYAPAYQFGTRIASDARYTGRNWEEIEAEARSEYQRQHPQGLWEQLKDAVRYGWQRGRGRA